MIILNVTTCADCSLIVNRLQLLLDCSELESRLTETLSLVNTDDCGKDQLATQSLLTKHQVQPSSKAQLLSRQANTYAQCLPINILH